MHQKNKTSQPMWEIYREDYNSPIEALENYYPEVLAENDQLKSAVAQIKNGSLIIDTIMKGLNL